MPANSTLLMLNADAVAAFIAPDAVLAAVREAFVLHSARQGRVFPVIREKLATGGVFGIKAGDVGTQDLLGFKAAGFWPANRAVGGEPHQATIMLVDPASGRPQCIIDGNAITTARTAAAGALGLQLLAPPTARSLCVFGTGVQATAHLAYALRVLPQLETVRYLSADGQPRPHFAASIGAGVRVLHCTDADAAVAASEVIITATPGAGPLFSAQAVQAGTHLNCVGADTRGKRELPEALLPRARVVVDDAVQARQIGELQWLPEHPCIELGDLLGGTAALARQESDITLFDMTGLALQDLTVARLIHAQACAQGAGIAVPWPW